MIQAIEKEIEMTAENENIETIYFGGGTPSLLTIEELSRLMRSLRSHFVVSPAAEITLEANPDDISLDVLQAWKSVGINRLSVGLQSFDEDELRQMNRAHSASQSISCLENICDADFNNFSVDLIYGSPMQTNKSLRRNFSIISSFNVPHISAYALTVEEGTLLHNKIKKGLAENVNPDKQSAHFHLLLSLMAAADYEQYEISNFCRSGFRSRHNSSYWSGKPYYGFGPSAHSFDGRYTRKWNVANNSLYLLSMEKNIIPSEEEQLTPVQRLNEYVMTSLRTAEGLDLDLVRKDFTEEDVQRLERAAERYVGNGMVEKNGRLLLLTTEGKFFADGIAADLFV